jgi:hypothetical protein
LPAWRLSSFIAALLAAYTVLVLPGAATATIDPQRARDAEMEMLVLMSAVQSGEGQIPRVSDPAVALAFTRAFDVEMIADQQHGAEDLAILSSLQQHAGKLAKAYISVGVQAGHDRQAAMERAAGNFLEYLPELGVIYDFNLVTGARICAITADLAQRVGAIGDEAPDIEASIAMIESMQFQLLELTIGFASDPHIQREWRFERLLLLDSLAGQYAQLLTATAARSIADLALAAAISEPDSQIAEVLQKFAFAILHQ